MVNALNGHIWFVDTVDGDIIDDKHIFVKSVRWVGGATSVAGNAVVIQEPLSDAILWSSTASGANYVEEAILETTWPQGFEVPTLDVGTLHITLR